MQGASILTKLNSAPMYLICGAIVAFVAVVCVIFLIRAYRAGKALGMDTTKMKRVIVSSATFSVLPSVGILLGVIALSGLMFPIGFVLSAIDFRFGCRCASL